MTAKEAAIALVKERLMDVASLNDFKYDDEGNGAKYLFIHVPAVKQEVVSIGFWDSNCWAWLLTLDYADPTFSDQLGEAISAHLGTFSLTSC